MGKPNAQQQNDVLEAIDLLREISSICEEAVDGLEAVLEDTNDDLTFRAAFHRITEAWFRVNESVVEAGIDV